MKWFATVTILFGGTVALIAATTPSKYEGGSARRRHYVLCDVGNSVLVRVRSPDAQPDELMRQIHVRWKLIDAVHAPDDQR